MKNIMNTSTKLLLIILLSFLFSCATAHQKAATYNKQGVLCSFKGQSDEAISNFNKAIEIDPSYLFAYLNRGDQYMRKGQFDQAISDFNKAIEIDPKFAGGYHGRVESMRR